MTERTIQPDEHAFIKNMLRAWGDEPVFTTWMRKEKHDRVQERILVIGKYRLVSIKRTFTGAKKVRRNGHLQDLSSIESKGPEHAKLTFRDKVKDWWIDLETPKALEIIKVVRDSLAPITVGWPEECLKISAPEECLLELESFAPGGGAGFIECYKSMCNYYRLPVSLAFCQHCQDTFDRGSDELDLTECPGIEPNNQASFDLTPVFGALRHNKYFKTIKLVRVPRREIIAKLAECLYSNTTISSVIMQYCGCGPEGFLILGNALEQNKDAMIQYVNFSGNAVRNQGVDGLAIGIKNLAQRGVHTLRLDNCSIGPQGLGLLTDAFEKNGKIALSLTELSLCNNPLMEAGSDCIGQWLGTLRFLEQTSLRRLKLAGTKVSLSSLCGAIGCGAQQLEMLDLRDNPIDKKGAEQFAVLLSSTGHLRDINLAGCKLPKASILLILHAMTHNSKLESVRVNLADNDIGDKGADSVARGISGGTNLHTLILSDNGLLTDGMKAVLEACTPLNIHTLALDRNVKKHKSQPAAEAVASFLQKCSSIRSLRLAGNVKFHFGPYMRAIFECIGGNSWLEELDITGNHIDDETAQVLVDQLRTNTGMRRLYWDDNRVSLSGYQMFKSMLNTNKTLCVMKFPRDDSNAYISLSKGSDVQRAKTKVKEVLEKIDSCLKENAAMLGLVQGGFIPHDAPFAGEEAEDEMPEFEVNGLNRPVTRRLQHIDSMLGYPSDSGAAPPPPPVGPSYDEGVYEESDVAGAPPPPPPPPDPYASSVFGGAPPQMPGAIPAFPEPAYSELPQMEPERSIGNINISELSAAIGSVAPVDDTPEAPPPPPF